MADTAAPTAEAETKPTSLRTVITASSAGTTFEWYDFFVFGHRRYAPVNLKLLLAY